MRISRIVSLACLPHVGLAIDAVYSRSSDNPNPRDIDSLEENLGAFVRDYLDTPLSILTRNPSHADLPFRGIPYNGLLQRDTENSGLVRRALSQHEVEVNIKQMTDEAQLLEQAAQNMQHFHTVKESSKQFNKADLNVQFEQVERLIAQTTHRSATGNLPTNQGLEREVETEAAQLRAARRGREAERLEAATSRLNRAKQTAVAAMNAVQKAKQESRSPYHSPDKPGGSRRPPGGGGKGSPLRKGFLSSPK